MKPQYELVIINASFEVQEVIPFNGNQLTLELDKELFHCYIRSTFNGETYLIQNAAE